jgi:hypothetical protein
LSIESFISEQKAERRKLLEDIHKVIIRNDKTVKARIGSMMGKEMIIYECGIFKYGLASTKNYMSLHVMPIYGSPELHRKYKELLPAANFQKGCINFKDEEDLPIIIVNQLITDCATIDLLLLREKYTKSKSSKK